MKKLILILLALSPLVLKAQSTDKANLKDTSSRANKDPLYLIDGKKIDKTEMSKAISPGDIMEIAVLKDVSATAIYGSAGANGVVLITTKKFATTAYQEKFSSLSDDYESYLTSHGTDDKAFIYVINDVPVPKDTDEINKLYKISKGDIESVTFVQDQPEGSKTLAKVVIKTKK
jgi:TonB-dependent SusC/RagA subfamily outer membrane receptor